MSPAAPDPSPPRGDARWLYPALAVIFAVTLTRGDLDLFATGEFRGVYDALADSLRRGEATLPRAVIGPEGFIMPWGRVMYFGALPALPRVLGNALLPGMHGRWSIVSCLAALLVAVWGCRRAVAHGLAASDAFSPRERAQVLRGATLLFAFGSPLLHLASDANLYFEAIAWAAAFALVAVSYAVEVVVDPRAPTRSYAALAAAGSLALLTRVTYGAAALLAAGAVALHVLLARPDLSRRARWVRLAALALPSLAGVAAQLAYNAMRWGSPWTFIVPSAYVLLPHFTTIFAQGQCHPLRLPWALYNYALPSPRFFSSSPPYVTLGLAAPLPAPVINGTSQGFLPLTMSAPALLLLAWRALAALLRDLRANALALALALCFGAQAAVILTFYHLAQRYTVEFLPGLLLLGSLALRGAPTAAPARARLLRTLAVLTAVSVATNVLAQTWWVTVEGRR